jgi:flavodoxin
MAQPGVVVAFSSRCGSTETIAHAAAVGAVNARALPRLRRLVDDGPVSTECADTLRRLKKEYVPPTEADIAGASALMIVPTAGMTPASDVWQSFIALLDRLAATGKLTGKVGAVIDAGDRQTVVSFSTALTKRVFALIATSSGDARAHGRAVGAAILTQSMPKP